MQELKHHVWLPVIPTEQMLLDLLLVAYWDDTPGGSRADAEQAYQRMLTFLPALRPGFVLAPLDPEEHMLLGLAGLEKFEPDSEEGGCTEFDAWYEGYQMMLRELSATGQTQH